MTTMQFIRSKKYPLLILMALFLAYYQHILITDSNEKESKRDLTINNR